MKKFYMTMVALLVAVAASAQVYVGGNFGVTSVSVDNSGDDDSETAYSFVPEVGYNFDKNWAAGISIGWAKGTCFGFETDGRSFSVEPYVRCTFYRSDLISVFCDGAVGYAHAYDGTDVDVTRIGVKPGVALNVGKFSMVAHVGFLGWQQAKTKTEHHYYDDDELKVNEWGVDVNGANLQLGLYYNF